MGAAQEHNAYRADKSKDNTEFLLSPKRRRRLHSMETQFRLLSALVGQRPRADAPPPEVIAHGPTPAAPAGESYGDLRAALWLLRRSRKR